MTSASLSLSFDLADDRALQPNGLEVTLNGMDVSGSFTYTPGADATIATAQGTVTLVPGPNIVAYRVADLAGGNSTGSVTFTYTPPSPPLGPAPAPAPLPRATSGASPSARDVVEAIYRLVVEREGDEPGIVGWTAQLNAGVTVKQIVRNFATSPEYQSRFVTGKTAQEVAAGVYRHVYGREAEPQEVAGWAPVVTSQGWIAVVDGLLNDWSYGEWFGEDAVPGAPVTVWDAARAPLVLEPGSATPNVNRSLCLTIAAGPGAAYECGDLRLVHGLPGLRSLNKGRAPTLLYNSQHATATPTVAARVMLPTSLGTPTQVDAILKVGPRWDQLAEVTSAHRTWPGSQWTPGQARRIVLSYDAQDEETGVREYALEIVATYPGGSTQRWVRRGTQVVVNRKNSPYGAGWWVAGVEQIKCIECAARSRILWVGGDGSTRIYQPTNVAGEWVAPRADGVPDTLRSVSGSTAAAYVRTEPGGVKVYFDIAGRHVGTVNRLDHQTYFQYTADGRLSQISVPKEVGGGAHVAFVFEYSGPGATLSRVTAPDLNNVAGRPTTLEHAFGDGRVTAITDPDGTQIRFDINHYIPAPARITMRRDRRGTDTYFGFDAGGKMSQIHTDMRGTGANITTYLAAQETRGLTGAPILPMDAHTILDGPRTDVVDVTRFWVDRFGSPWRIVDATAGETIITRSDARFPALATRVDGVADAAGVRATISASYNARGNIEAETDWNSFDSRLVVNPQSGLTSTQAVYATTRYAYENASWPDFATRVTQPMGEVLRADYYSTGSRAWQQPGDDQSRRVTYGYNALGLVSSVTLPVVNGVASVETYEYDARGNLNATVSPATAAAPTGVRTTLYNDEFGRTWKSEVPLDATHTGVSQSTFYPNSDRVETTRKIGPAMNGAGAQTLWVRNEYDAEGNATAVERWSDPDLAMNAIGHIRTEWTYDAAGRNLTELSPGSASAKDSVVYDVAGHVVEAHTRRVNPSTGERLVIRMKYDVAGRITERRVPEVHYILPRQEGIPQAYRPSGQTGCAGAFLTRTFPSRPNDGLCGYVIEEDVQTFGYDAWGNLKQADNRDAQVRRGYNVNGTVSADTLRIRTTTGNDFSQHQYALSFAYDLNGRRVQLTHPGQLAPAPGQNTVQYGYDPLTGSLDRVTDPMGNTFRYEYNVRGEVRRKIFVGAAYEEYDVDNAGAMTGHRAFQVTSGSYQFNRYAVIVRDALGRVASSSNMVGLRDTITSKYSGLGYVVGTTSRGYRPSGTEPAVVGSESFGMDALGHAFGGTSVERTPKEGGGHVEATNAYSSGYLPGTDRLAFTTQTLSLDPPELLSYNPRVERPPVTRRDNFFYDAAGNLEFTTQGYMASGSCTSESKSNADCDDRASFYAADGALRAADQRSRRGDDSNGYWRSMFEEYRYDALGRRVWVRARGECAGIIQEHGVAPPCYSSVRRTVWDGDAELWEIQMPGQDTSSYLENDTAPLPIRPFTGWIGGSPELGGPDAPFSPSDPNAFYGRVAYTHGLGTDQPLALIRIGLNHYFEGNTFTQTAAQGVSYAPFVAFPLSDWRGHVDAAVFAGGAKTQCQTFSGIERCTGLGVSAVGWSAYGQIDPSVYVWHGTLLNGKRDAAGTMYRRARYYDPQTGRFTQEDPVGIAGGLNLYGYAGGDPVNYADPSGQCPTCLVGAGIGMAVGGYVGFKRGGWKGAIVGGIVGGAGGALLGAGVGLLFPALNATVATTTAAGAAEATGTVELGALISASPSISVAAEGAGITLEAMEGEILIGSIEGAAGRGTFMSAVVRENGTLFLRGLHTEGSATLKELLSAARLWGRELGVKRVVIEGAERTTGALVKNRGLLKGAAPRVIELFTGL